MQTVGSILDRRGGLAPGFDLLRIVLALSVVIWHGRAIVNNEITRVDGFFELGSYGIIAAFFGLSGFLITGSALRLRLRDFLLNRALRIVPALAVEVVLSALVLGPLFTVLPLADYATDPHTVRYFANILGFIVYTLPGVFAHNPTDVVNGSLWTIPHEIACYALMSLCVLTGSLRRPGLVVGAAGLIILLGFLLGLASPGEPASLPARLADKLLVDKASRLYVAFLLGIAAYLYRYRLPYDLRLIGVAVLAVGAAGALDLTAVTAVPVFPFLNLVVLPALVYLTVCLGVTDLWVPTLLRRGDYSYGIYLYGWPIQQALVALVPVRATTGQVLLALPCILLFAMVSWHLIERPILGLRRRFSFVAARRFESGGGRPADPAAASFGPSR
ncbi:acyltransferase family protein [Methylobacterium sp. A49B]|uniref:Acyltransferase n=1 Tax=Methylobacterium mesophilicum SR1.6/6 TaxID=908290 RepID=A0A6B9FPH4_9HYPH|nr:acyltransferase [Methylobacterium mesophilicum]QGY03769.1 acyltransferase [Methylobacterium mesophilicum SR1.6/6]